MSFWLYVLMGPLIGLFIGLYIMCGWRPTLRKGMFSPLMATTVDVDNTSDSIKIEYRSYGMSENEADVEIVTFLEKLEDGEFWLNVNGCARNNEYQHILTWDNGDSPSPARCVTFAIPLYLIMMVKYDLASDVFPTRDHFFDDDFDEMTELTIYYNILAMAAYAHVSCASKYMQDKFWNMVGDDIFGGDTEEHYIQCSSETDKLFSHIAI